MRRAALTDAQVRSLGWQALVEKLGPSCALRFAMQTETGSGNYSDLRDKILGNKTVDQLVAQMRPSKRPRRRAGR
jgi:hypothetical protein